ncbi:MAG TPA: 50S ribosomal protein L4 [Bacteroidia bacterium]|jgi:large subunit ribosomal protein L4|nr:50S ribosomal protein L4 [Bacteroidia bacterium]MBP7262336.1 50S ribosomal protein L4 [Bacteroidia bacterium]MBP9180604.1 50S ribosomal protein L4 [Bacteroidia bacterium]HLP33153.1 50S ribosomal protein L4 [Bacteroidia bacterium]
MELAVLNTKGSETGRKVSLDGTIFSVDPNDHAIWLDVKQYLANKRQGTHKTKDKSEVSGSTKKLHRQKGTGGSRKGSIKSGTFVGGARIHGPRPRDYSFKLNKKLKDVARKSALTYKAQGNNILVLEEFNMATPKTREYISILENLKVNNSKTLLVVADYNTNLYLSSRNLAKAKVMKAADLNTYEIMNAKNIILLENSVKAIEETLNK